MKQHLAVTLLAVIVTSNSLAQQCNKAPTTGSYKEVCITTDKLDADNCPLISAIIRPSRGNFQ